MELNCVEYIIWGIEVNVITETRKEYVSEMEERKKEIYIERTEIDWKREDK